MKFKMLSPPIIPIRLSQSTHYYIYSDDTLQSVIDWATENKINCEDVKFERAFSEYESNFFKALIPESDFDYSKRVKKYKKELIEYNKWLKLNIKKIEKYKQQKLDAEKQKSIANIKKQIKNLNKDLEKLKETHNEI